MHVLSFKGGLTVVLNPFNRPGFEASIAIFVIDYQKSIIRSIVTERSRVNRKSTVKNRLLKNNIDFILDAHAYHILPEFCRKRRSISPGVPRHHHRYLATPSNYN